MFRNLFDGPHIILLVLVIVILFGWKKMPDAARSLGRSMRIFKSEVEEMKKDGTSSPSAASSDTVKGETVPPPAQPAAEPVQDPSWKPAADSTQHAKHDQPPA
jgi:sec-independent protein translocase protein TatA